MDMFGRFNSQFYDRQFANVAMHVRACAILIWLYYKTATRPTAILYKTGPESVHLYVPILMYLYVIRI